MKKRKMSRFGSTGFLERSVSEVWELMEKPLAGYPNARTILSPHLKLAYDHRCVRSTTTRPPSVPASTTTPPPSTCSKHSDAPTNTSTSSKTNLSHRSIPYLSWHIAATTYRTHFGYIPRLILKFPPERRLDFHLFMIFRALPATYFSVECCSITLPTTADAPAACSAVPAILLDMSMGTTSQEPSLIATLYGRRWNFASIFRLPANDLTRSPPNPAAAAAWSATFQNLIQFQAAATEGATHLPIHLRAAPKVLTVFFKLAAPQVLAYPTRSIPAPTLTNSSPRRHAVAAAIFAPTSRHHLAGITFGAHAIDSARSAAINHPTAITHLSCAIKRDKTSMQKARIKIYFIVADAVHCYAPKLAAPPTPTGPNSFQPRSPHPPESISIFSRLVLPFCYQYFNLFYCHHLTFSLSHRTSIKPLATVPRHLRQPDHTAINYPRFNSTELSTFILKTVFAQFAPHCSSSFLAHLERNAASLMRQSLLNFEIISRNSSRHARGIPPTHPTFPAFRLPAPDSTLPPPLFFFNPTRPRHPLPPLRRTSGDGFRTFGTECEERTPGKTHQSGIATNTHKEADLASLGSWLLFWDARMSGSGLGVVFEPVAVAAQ
ncbi:hypothetical protein B0H17DRAFT_1128741 [Mycena rosella]|uniref:Uncharacterized protein n=1 Tax=Mycena rosella TaxID=1033263 RepID=A0AAD7DUV1_MYCRO|nr:hypothetical protein B0H17DRAFT_1128741 [Mycena rosella]